MTYREALRLAMRQEMERDDRVFVMGEEVGVFDGSYKVTAGLLEEFGPDRVRDTPISEEGFVGAGVGAAMLGERPIVEIMTLNFLLVAMDQVVNHAAKIGAMFGGEVRCPLVIRTPNGAGNQLTAQHSQSFDGWFAGTPGLKVVAPASPADAKGLLKAAIRDDDPVLVIENLPIYKEKGEVELDPDLVTPIGLANVAREGSDLTIVSHSFATVRALKVAEQVQAEHGVSVEVVDLRSLRPLDVETVAKSVAKTNRALCVEEGWPSYGVSAEIAARIQHACFDDLDAPVERLGMAEVPLPYAKELELAAMPTEDRIAAAVLRTLDLAMSEIVMPRLSDSMEEGTILTWLKKVGDEVAVGEELVEIETDKANMAYESDVAGTLTEILAGEGETLVIGAPIAVVGEADGPISSDMPSRSSPSTGGAPRPSAGAPESRRGPGRAHGRPSTGGAGRAPQSLAGGPAARQGEGRRPRLPPGLWPRGTDREEGRGVPRGAAPAPTAKAAAPAPSRWRRDRQGRDLSYEELSKLQT